MFGIGAFEFLIILTPWIIVFAIIVAFYRLASRAVSTFEKSVALRERELENTTPPDTTV